MREALRRAYDEAIQHRRSGFIADSVHGADEYWPGDPDPSGPRSTDIHLIPERNLTWGVFTDCLGVMGWFVMVYPEWDFGFDIEVDGVAGISGVCTFTTR